MSADAVRVLLVEDSAADAQLTSDMLAFARTPRCDLTRVECLEEARRRAISGRAIDHVTTTRVCKDGTAKIVALSVSAIRDAQAGSSRSRRSPATSPRAPARPRHCAPPKSAFAAPSTRRRSG